MAIRPVTMIIPTIPKDYKRVKRDYKRYFECLPVRKIVFIGPGELEEPVQKDAADSGFTDSVEYINENSIIPFEDVKRAMIDRIASEGYEMAENSKPGWYYQQFLKMAYATVCEDDYYISWDSDTIPLRRIKLFNEKGKPYLDTKAEYNPGYFRTIKNLFGMEKSHERSFIAEHLLFSKELMLEMIDEINSLDYTGDTFYEKIFYAIDIENMRLGFSEFETYGTWIMNRHPEVYALRQWKSMRRANLFVSSFDMNPADIAWLARDYDAASFESYHPLIPDLAKLFKDPKTRRLISAKDFYMRVINTGMFGEVVNGMVKDGDVLTPV